MSSTVENHLIYQVINAPVRSYPYPHMYIPDIFPKDYYDELQRNIPDPKVMLPINQVRPVKGYDERFVLELESEQVETLPEGNRRFWKDLAHWMLAGRFREAMLAKFKPLIDLRFQGQEGAIEFYDEALLVEDITKYALGPHSDAVRKVITMLFYLPKDESQSHLGTSIYLPNDPQFRCDGGPHYKFKDFTRLVTMPFKPNALFVFFKNATSFHGVEPVTDPDTRRWLLLYDIYFRPAQFQQPTAPTMAVPQGGVSFKF
jgi:hypothetical protein